ncbi:hypothetical protein LAZ67_17001043 [Cordylochernes scorpioides]|uniref:Serpin domain-containing protein n=1 Tax=Cordylochernes scorpioides TaxID=51811 RepID=A0ABY6LD08_9ARAC|nr:hypothetical protein LAZ67_17001043 [Cordylochernes scorpioides]
MIYGAARGQTARDIERTLGYDDIQDVHQYYKDFYQQNNDYNWAYGVYVDQDYSIQESYQRLIQSYYQSPVSKVDFDNGEEVRREINEMLYYLSAAYYGGSLKYHSGQTYTGQFYNYGDRDSQVKYWTLKGPIYYYYSQDYKAVRIPYYDNEYLSLMVVVPERYEGLDQLKEYFSYKTYSHIWSQMYQEDVEVQIPEFKLDYYQPLSDVLQHAGFQDIFREGADFSGMSGELYVSQVGHRAYFEMEEPSSDYSPHHHSSSGRTVKVDRPFVFYVVDHRTGMIYYSGYFSQF